MLVKSKQEKDLDLNAISEYPYASVNGFKFFSLIGANYTKNTDTLVILIFLLFSLI
jgi:hypothetical protein